MGHTFRYDRRVQFRDTDAAGIVHFTVFFNYMEEAETELLRDLGMDVLMTDEEGAYSFPRVAARCDYLAPLAFGDVAVIDVSVAKLGESSVTYTFDFSHNGKAIAKGEMTAVCCRLPAEGPPKSMRIPAEVIEKLSDLVR